MRRDWCADGLSIAERLRSQDATATKLAIARAISGAVEDAPRNVATIENWLRERERAGELTPRRTPVGVSGAAAAPSPEEDRRTGGV